MCSVRVGFRSAGLGFEGPISERIRGTVASLRGVGRVAFCLRRCFDQA